MQTQAPNPLDSPGTLLLIALYWAQCCHFLAACRQGKEQGTEESPAHWLDCEAYTDLRVGLDPEYEVEDRAKYLGKVIERRERLEKVT